ncbi:MAG: hypothetical protein HQM08_10740 [Candidatus Riflebacteria bacterium]|nr:hypothetical protein [Candidatus Riflebacteria bacterium]
MEKTGLTVGIDMGSVSINAVLLSHKKELIEELPYRRHFGKTLELCQKTLEDFETKYGKDSISRVVFTGTHGETIAKTLGTYFEIETTAITRGLFSLVPDAHSVISIGGHDSALLILNPTSNGFVLEDFKLNEACAAGTGSFIDQQAERVFSDKPEFTNITDPQKRIEGILNAFISEGLKSESPANVACRCTVFTKSDMIHLQNKGIAIKHIIAGLHEGVAKNFKSTLICNRVLKTPIVLIGGYAGNRMARDSFERILGFPITIPAHHAAVGAIGCALSAIEKSLGQPVHSSEIASLKASDAFAFPQSAPLKLNLSHFEPCGEVKTPEFGKQQIKAYMGWDIGSTTTKMVLMSPSGEVLYKRYIPTEGQPVVAIKKCLKHFISSMPVEKFDIIGVGTTGSGREVANLFVGADDVVNEVTAHARGTTFFRPDVETIFELGGQDAKYTSLSNGFVVDFKMNKVCAAGTGSFLEETARKLGINIACEYEDLAMSSKAPYKLTERCTVFMESDLMSLLQMGAQISDLLAGLSRAVVHNYLNRVVQDGKIGRKISFQGGPSLNKSVVAAFESVIGKPIITLPHREVLGALGAALHAKEEIEKREKEGQKVISKFRGFGVTEAAFSHSEEVCHRNPNCHNQCKLQIYRIGDNEAIYGGECGMYESRASAIKRAPDFNRVRQQLFQKKLGEDVKVIDPSTCRKIDHSANPRKSSSKPTLGIPRSLTFFQMGIFWVRLMKQMGFDIYISPETDSKIVDQGIEAMTCETCFPIKISHGHARYLKDYVDFMFLPMMIEMETPPHKRGYYCPYLEANTYMLKAALGLNDKRLVMPAIYLKEGEEGMKIAFEKEFERLGLSFDPTKFSKAYAEAIEARNSFDKELKRVGQTVLENLKDRRAIVVIGRPYSAYDSRTNLNLFSTFSRLGILAIPQEFLNLEPLNIEDDYPNMYWGFGDKILKAAKFINGDPRLFGLYLTSFSCGPDSFILHFFNHEMSRTERPYLELELDEHSAGAGVETRLLAFIDVITNQKNVKTIPTDVNFIIQHSRAPLTGRTLYIPKMAEGTLALAAAFEAVGSKAKVMDTYTKEGLEFGKSHTSGKECFPCTVTTGDMFNLIHKLREENREIENEIAFFMPETEGPCRFGQYNRLHRILLDSYGMGAIPILSPTSEDSYRCNGFFTTEQADEFRKIVWQAIVYVDILEKALWRVRPYEKKPGETDEVFKKSFTEAIHAIKKGAGTSLLKAAKKAAKAFDAIERRDEKRPLIGIVGEIYVRTHKESNQNLIKVLEQMGCETFTSSIAEWVEYTTHTGIQESMEKFWRSKTIPNLLDTGKFWLTAKYQRTVAWLLGRPFAKLLKGRFDHSTEDILHEVNGIFSNHINGEAILSIGGALSFAHGGTFNGVINALPFTCMPSTIATSILKVHLREKIPYVDMVYDGTILPNRMTNLATFAFQANQNMERKGKS